MAARIVIGLAAVAVLAFGCAIVAVSSARAQRAEARAAPDERRAVPVRGGNLSVVTLAPRGAPSGRTLLLLHGASGNLKDLEESIGRRLAEHHRVVLVDRPGHGRSDRLGGREMSSPARQADAISEALDVMGVGRVVVVGHSWSGSLATNLALDHPSHVAGLVLLSPATHPYPGGASWYNNAAATPVIGPLFAALISPLASFAFEKGVASTFEPHKPPPNYIERTDAKLLLRPSEFSNNAEDLVDLKPFLIKQSPRYGAITVPTTIITADKDTIVGPEIHARPLHRQIKGSKLVVIKDGSHMTHWTATDRVLAEINELAAKTRP